MNLSISFDPKTISPLKKIGLTGDFWSINIETMRDTFIAMAIIFALVIVARLFLKKELNPITLMAEKSLLFFDNLCKESFGKNFKYNYFFFVSSLFFFTLFGCMVGLLPFVEETTKDLNTAFALGTLSFLYVNFHKIKEKGIKKYLKGFLEPIFIMLPLNIIGELAKVASMSFRLFGNILGGSIIFLIAVKSLETYKLYFFAICIITLISYLFIEKFVGFENHKLLKLIITPFLVITFSVAGAQIFFGIFESFVQSFVITMLTITYLAVALHDEDDESTEPQKTAKCGEVS